MNKDFQVKEMVKKYEVYRILVLASMLKPSRAITFSYLKIAVLREAGISETLNT